MPKPKLYVLVGVPGSGKSTYAQKNFQKEKVLNSDKIRAEILGDETDQTKNKLVFKVLYERMRKFLRDGEDVVIDATNIDRVTRKFIFEALGEISCTKIAIWIKTPRELCYKFNKMRKRQEPKWVIDKYFKKFEPPTQDEGFDEVVVVEISDKT